MKMIGGITGMSAHRELPEEYNPEHPPPIQDIINLIRETYQFASFPILGPSLSLAGPFTFAGGRFSAGSASFGIAQLVLLTDGDIVATTSTSDSDLVLEHLISLMDEKFGYRLRTAYKRKSYHSTIVVEFDDSLGRYIEKLSRIEELLKPTRAQGDPYRLQFKGLTFGGDTSPPGVDVLVQIERADFTIERRAGQSNPNRYFCTAPMTTEDHMRILRQIEEIARGS
jgi:hypothetical protein